MNENFNRVATALLVNYASVYYVDLKTDHYECYSTNAEFQGLELQQSGEDFFTDCQRDIMTVVYSKDSEMMARETTKEAFLKRLSIRHIEPLRYRLDIDGRPVWHMMRIFRDASNGEDCLIIGVMNVDKSIRMEQQTKTYNEIAKALADRYSTIYYIDLVSDNYVEYTSSDDYKDLNIPTEGTDFFTDSQNNIKLVIHPEDQERVLGVINKRFLTRITENGSKYRVEYRLIMNGDVHYVRLVASRTASENRLVVALENIDNEIQQREELKNVSEKNVIFNHIAESLARQYGMIYYIDTETDDYIEFTASEEFKEFNISPAGSDFFRTSQRNVSMIAHPSDRERLFDALDRRVVMDKLKLSGNYSITYRLVMPNGDVSHKRMNVFWANDNKHLIMTVQTIDNEVQKENEVKKMIADNAIFFQIAESLANQYDTIYYVNMLTDHYIEFSSTDVYKSLDVMPEGDDFFSESARNIERVIHPEDRDAFMRMIQKQNLVQKLQGKHMLIHNYRLLIGEDMMYARMSAMWANDNKHVIVGVMNIDAEVRKEKAAQERLSVANEKAYRDELTGAKNKASYREFESHLQSSIDHRTADDFAVVVCDVNGLKHINDTMGHSYGDELIKSAADLICHVWSHSPVFRIGGDEFAVILEGEDFDKRKELMAVMRMSVLENKAKGGVVVACGMSDYIRRSDSSVAEVFDRADNLMYQNKAELKK